jgi:hypothetical protein
MRQHGFEHLKQVFATKYLFVWKRRMGHSGGSVVYETNNRSEK